MFWFSTELFRSVPDEFIYHSSSSIRKDRLLQNSDEYLPSTNHGFHKSSYSDYTHNKTLEQFTKLSASHEDPGSSRSSSSKRGSTTGMGQFFIVILKNSF